MTDKYHFNFHTGLVVKLSIYICKMSDGVSGFINTPELKNGLIQTPHKCFLFMVLIETMLNILGRKTYRSTLTVIGSLDSQIHVFGLWKEYYVEKEKTCKLKFSHVLNVRQLYPDPIWWHVKYHCHKEVYFSAASHNCVQATVDEKTELQDHRLIQCLQ